MTQPKPTIDIGEVDKNDKQQQQLQLHPLIPNLAQKEKLIANNNNNGGDTNIKTFLNRLYQIPLVNEETYKNDPKIIQQIEELKGINLKLENQISNQNKEIRELGNHIEECTLKHNDNWEHLYNDLLQEHTKTQREYTNLNQKYKQLQQLQQSEKQSVVSTEVKCVYNQEIKEKEKEGEKNLFCRIEDIESKLDDKVNNLQERLDKQQTQQEWILQDLLEQKAKNIRSEIKTLFLSTYLNLDKQYTGDLQTYFGTEQEQKSHDLDEFALKLGIDQEQWALLKPDKEMINSTAYPPILEYIKNKQPHLYRQKVFNDDTSKTFEAYELMIQYIDSKFSNQSRIDVNK